MDGHPLFDRCITNQINSIPWFLIFFTKCFLPSVQVIPNQLHLEIILSLEDEKDGKKKAQRVKDIIFAHS